MLIHIRIADELLARVDEAAEIDGRSRSAMVTVVLAEFFGMKRLPRITGGAIDVAIESSQKVPFNSPPKDSSVPRPAGAMRPHNLGGELAVESAKEAGQPLDNATPTDVSGGRAIDKTALK